MRQNFDPLLYLSLARELAGQGATEVKYRTATGRAYYALFLIARAKSNVTGVEDVHKRVGAVVSNKAGYSITGSQLRALHRLRIEADYYLAASDPSLEDWARNWKDAEYLVDAILPKLQEW